MMFTAFFARVKPVSTMANPACMKNTRKAARRVQIKFMFFWTSSTVRDGAGAAAASTAAVAGAAASCP